jgi:hypothetical protein
VTPAALRVRDALTGVFALGLGLALVERVTPALAAPVLDATAPASAAPVLDVPAPASAAPPSAPPTPSLPTPRGDRPEPVASYTLEARLDAASHRIDGQGTLVFVNRSSAALPALYFHLYLNAFKNEKSVFLGSPFGQARSVLRADDWGYIDVLRLSARELGGVDLWPAHELATPEEPDDETDVRVPLPKPLASGETLTLELTFRAKLPSVVLRTGYVGDFHFVGQWFPKLARLESDGTFAHFPFHPQAEFYADYGDYDVTLNVPAAAVVGASGKRVSSELRGDRRVERYRAEGVHDFAWAAWPSFRELDARVAGVDVRVLFPPGHTRVAERTLETLAFALPRASALYGAYPYPTLTVVHPPEPAGEAGGMEYPTLIATGGPWFAGLLGDRGIESVTIHELLHQWFYGLVASNEARFPFLDEGLTTYAELRLLETGFGQGSAFEGFDVTLSATALARAFSAARAEDVAVSSPAAGFPSFRTLGALVYSRTAAILETLARVYGRERVDAALANYARRFRFAHPTPSDFVNRVGDALGPDAKRVLTLALDERGRVDFLVREVASTPEREPGGVFDRASGRETVPSSSSGRGRHRGRAVILRHGSLELPVEIDLHDAAGNRRRERWDGHGALHVIDWHGDAPLTHVVVDPEHRIVLDDDLLNNAAAITPRASSRTLERSVYFAELLLALFGP